MKTPEEFVSTWFDYHKLYYREEIADKVRDYLRQFRDEVNARAEQKMLTTGKLEGAHFAAMRQIFTEIGLDK